MSDVKPALTAEQWAASEASFFGINMRLEEGGVGFGIADCETVFNDEERHALAALCLHGQPYGFTWEDVELLRDLEAIGPEQNAMYVRHLADRLEALLPPRGD